MMLLLLALLILATPVVAAAQETTADEQESRATGLPSALDWTFNFDAAWASFGFANSLFTNPRDEPSLDLSDQWFEGYVKPALSASYAGSRGEVYGKVSAVGARTYGSAPELAGLDFSSFQVEDLSIGWRSGAAVEALGEDALEVVVGRTPYQLGRGFLLWDGSGEGGSRGGYWVNARTAFELAGIARFTRSGHRAEAFYLDKDEVPENDTGSRLWGANYEWRADDENTFGATYMRWFADPSLEASRDGLQVVNLRAYTAPIPRLTHLSFELEYALEDNDALRDSQAWSLQGAYRLTGVAWTPTLSYRYAFFEGDDPETPEDEAFDPLFLGFYDWGSWWQGEIAGEYFLSNSNLISHQVRLHTTPTEAVGTGLILYRFLLDRPASFAPGVTDRHLAVEADWYLDWEINETFTLSIVAAVADPGTAVQQAFERTARFTYGMVYFSYSY